MTTAAPGVCTGAPASKAAAPIVSFKRIEKKFMLPPGAFDRLMAGARGHVRPDEFGVSDIRSLYLDTPDGWVARYQQTHPLYKEKVRIRRYGPAAGPDDAVFVELKKKYKGVSYKRRVKTTVAEAMALVATGARPATVLAREGASGRQDRQILEEIAFTLERYRPLGGLLPAMLVQSHRQSFAGTDGDGLRLTFDFDVTYRTHDLDLLAPEGGRQLLSPGSVLLEVKAPGAMPLWLAHGLGSVGATATAFSKYGRAYQALRDSVCP
jgi:hypothetical protein